MSTNNQKPIVQGSSTGAPGAPIGLDDRRNQYDPTTTGYNPATSAGYSTSSAGGPHQHHHQPPSPANDYDRVDVSSAPSTAQRAQMEDTSATNSSDARSARAGENVGKGIKGVAAGIHVSFYV